MEVITIDGSLGEGGGQILRSALAFSMLTKKPFRITDIRKNRTEPGLKAQHLAAVKFIVKNSTSKAVGAEIGSSELSFFPGEWKGILRDEDIGTAGSITLFLQAVLLPLMFSKRCTFSVTGGTDVAWSIPASTFSEQTLLFFRKYAHIDFFIKKRGYYPRGGGVVELSISPKILLSDFSSFEEFLEEARKMGRINLLHKGSLVAVRGESHASAELQSRKVAERQASAAALELKDIGCPVEISSSYSHSESAGSGISVYALYSQPGSSEFDVNQPIILGSDILGEQRKPAESIGFQAAQHLISKISSDFACDYLLADQLIPLLALFGGDVKAEGISAHLKSNVAVAEAFLGRRFEIDEKKGIVRAL